MLRLIILRLMESYFRHRWLYLLPILLMVGIALVDLSVSKPKFISTGILMVQRQSLLAKLTSITSSDISWQTPASATVGEFRELMQTDSFLRAVIQQTDLEAEMAGGSTAVDETIDDVRQSVWASSQGDNQVLVAAAHEQPQLAYQLAKATIETFVQWKINADKTDSEAAHEFFTELSVSYKAEADRVREKLYNYLREHPVPLKGDRSAIEELEIAQLKADLDSAEIRYTNALNKDEDAQLAAAQAEENARQSYVIIDAPHLPDKSSLSRRDIALQVGVFIVAGIILSGIGIIGGALLDRSFLFPIDVWHGVNLKVLTNVPDVTPLPQKKRKEKRIKHQKIKGDHPEEKMAEGMDLILAPMGVLDSADEARHELEGAETPLLAGAPEAATTLIISTEKKQKPLRGKKGAVSRIEQDGNGKNSEPPAEPESPGNVSDEDVINLFETAVKGVEKVKAERS